MKPAIIAPLGLINAKTRLTTQHAAILLHFSHDLLHVGRVLVGLDGGFVLVPVAMDRSTVSEKPGWGCLLEKTNMHREKERERGRGRGREGERVKGDIAH